MPETKKKSVLDNYNFALIYADNKRATLISTQEELDRMIEAQEIKDGDLIIKLTSDNLSVAKLVNHIKLV